MCDPSDQLKMLLVSSQGLDGDPVERARQAAQFDAVFQQVVSRERVGEATDPGVETSVDGTVLAAPVYEDGVLIGSLAVAATRWRYDGADYELLLRFADDQFDVHHQPIVAFDDGTVVAVEAVARWQHPERGMSRPPCSSRWRRSQAGSAALGRRCCTGRVRMCSSGADASPAAAACA